MPLIVKTGKLLRNASKLASNLACCCGFRFCPCNVTAPANISLKITLDTLETYNLSPECNRASVEAIVNRTFILSQANPDQLVWTYNEGFQKTAASFALGCSTGSVVGQVIWIDQSPCWVRYDILTFQNNNMASICNFAENPWTGTSELSVYSGFTINSYFVNGTVTIEATAL